MGTFLIELWPVRATAANSAKPPYGELDQAIASSLSLVPDTYSPSPAPYGGGSIAGPHWRNLGFNGCLIVFALPGQTHPHGPLPRQSWTFFASKLRWLHH